MRTEKRRWLWFAVVLAALAGFTAPAFAGSLEPDAPPGPTMKTLDEIPPTWSQKLPAAQRFKLVLDGAAVLDKETGLVWEKSPSTYTMTWPFAIFNCNNIGPGGREGWRLPTIEELASIRDISVSASPMLPSGHPFTNVQSAIYWSATTVASDSYGSAGPTSAWYVSFDFDTSGVFPGNMNLYADKTAELNVWCVRGRHGYDGW